MNRYQHSNRRPGRRSNHPPRPAQAEAAKKLPPLAAGDLRIIPLGGVEQVGQNMTAIEYGNDIIIVDAGIEFASEDTPGVDFIIPNTAYLEERKDKIRAIFITHGHLDHIGAIPFVIERLGNPPIYSRQFGALMIEKRQEEYPQLPKLDMKIVGGEETIKIGEHFKVNTFPISHTIPDSMGLIITTPLGDLAIIEDVRVDNVDGKPTPEEYAQYERFKNREILLLTMDSTSVEKAGFSIAEQTVVKNLEKHIKETPHRLIVGTFASQVERIIAIIELAKKYGRKVAIDGRSMKTNTEVAKNLKLIDGKNLIPIQDIDKYPKNKILILATGAQGEEYSVLWRLGNRQHKLIKLEKSDTVMLSSSIIPGNERSIVKLKDNLYRSEAKIITYLDSDIHASGHGNREELRWIHEQINYRFFMPLHGHHYMLRQHADLARSLGVPEKNIIVPDNGSLVEIRNEGKTIIKLKEKAPSQLIMVDGLGTDGVKEVVIRDRMLLAQEGMIVIIALVNVKTGKVLKSPDIISRGFVYLKESQDLLHQVRTMTKRKIEDTINRMHPINFDYVKNILRDEIGKHLFQKTHHRPIVLPVLIEV